MKLVNYTEEYIDVFKSTEKGKTELEELCAKYGNEPKEIKVMFLVEKWSRIVSSRIFL